MTYCFTGRLVLIALLQLSLLKKAISEVDTAGMMTVWYSISVFTGFVIILIAVFLCVLRKYCKKFLFKNFYIFMLTETMDFDLLFLFFLRLIDSTFRHI